MSNVEFQFIESFIIAFDAFSRPLQTFIIKKIKFLDKPVCCPARYNDFEGVLFKLRSYRIDLCTLLVLLRAVDVYLCITVFLKEWPA